MNPDDKIYVAGHRGLVGSAITRYLSANGYRNLVFRSSSELDLRRQADTEAFFEKEMPDYVFLAAARVGGIVANSTYKADFIYDNIMIASNVIAASYKFGVKRLLNLGSSCIYPRLAQQPMKEEYLLTGPLEPTNEPYAIAKIAAIKLCRYFNEQYGTDFISVMPANLYGPGDNFNLETAHVIPSMLRKFHLARLLKAGDFAGIRRDLSGYPLGFGLVPDPLSTDDAALARTLSGLGIMSDHVALWGTGSPLREFFHSDDLAEACVYIVGKFSKKDIGEFVNIGSGVELSIKQIAELVKEICGYDGGIVFDSTKPDGTPRKLGDNSKIIGLGWKPRIPLREGLGMMYEWYLGQTAS